MIRRLFLNTLAVAALALIALAFPASASAATIVENLHADRVSNAVPGQSLTTPDGGSFDHVSFNFFDATGEPVANGTLYIFTQPIFSATQLHSGTAGFVARSTGVINGIYQFDASVTLDPSTQYFLYSTGAGSYARGEGSYAGGQAYSREFPNLYFSRPAFDWCFRLSGTPVIVDTDGDGIADDEDAVPNSDLRSHVDTGDGATSVPNDVDETGTSLQDVINALYANAENHGQYVSAITSLADELRKAGLITNKQAAELKSGAAKAK